MIAGYDMQQVTGDHIGKADYIKAQKEVGAILSCKLPMQTAFCLKTIRRTMQVGMSGDKAEFEIMFAEMEAWKATYYTTVIPRMVRIPRSAQAVTFQLA